MSRTISPTRSSRPSRFYSAASRPRQSEVAEISSRMPSPGSTTISTRASLHAKCIIVDDERTLVTSANFTDRGQSRNIEAGVVIEDKVFSEELAGQWRQLVSEGLLRKYEG